MKFLRKLIEAIVTPAICVFLIVTVAYAATYVLSDGKEVYIMNGSLTVSGAVKPGTNGSSALGSTSSAYSDLYIGDGTDTTGLESQTDGLIVRAITSDAADNQYIEIAGGGATGPTRGAIGQFFGNEKSGNPGQILLQGGAVSTGTVTLTSRHDDADVIIRGGTTPADRVTVEADTGNVVLATGALDLATSGKTLILEDGTAASTCIGSGTLTAATPVTISTTCIQTGDYVFITRTSFDADGLGTEYVNNIVNGTSFDVTSVANDTATFNWIIIKGQ